jgi:hypothetical protein
VKNLISRMILPIAAALTIGVPVWGSFVIPDASISAAKISNGSITQAKLAGRANGTTVGAGGVGISASSTTFSSSTAAFVDVTPLSVTITTTGRPVTIFMIADGDTANASQVATTVDGSGNQLYQVKFLRDATTVALFSIGGTFAAGAAPAVAPSSFRHLDFPSAGTYTYKVQVKPFLSTTINVTRAKLVAFEL